MSKLTEVTSWIVCDVCDIPVVEGSSMLTGWLEIETHLMGVISDTGSTKHLCLTCSDDFDNFWGE